MKLIDEIAPHTIRKLDLIEKYTEAWAIKLLKYPKCKGIVFIDGMSNSGMYIDKNTKREIPGTALRVTKKLYEYSKLYKEKSIKLYFNDKSVERIQYLKSLLQPFINQQTDNFKIEIFNMDVSDFLECYAQKNSKVRDLNTLLVYDPYNDDIDWEVLNWYFNNWGEIILNHMVSDIVRNRHNDLKDSTKRRYEKVYLDSFDNLKNEPKERYQKRVEKIIEEICEADKNLYIACVPFFISTNAHIFNLLFISHNIKGFKLFKNNAWKLNCGNSAVNIRNEISIFQPPLFVEMNKELNREENYTLYDVIDYIVEKYQQKNEVYWNEIWSDLDYHPIFVAEGFKPEIKNLLKEKGYIVKREKLVFKGK